MTLWQCAESQLQGEYKMSFKKATLAAALAISMTSAPVMAQTAPASSPVTTEVARSGADMTDANAQRRRGVRRGQGGAGHLGPARRDLALEGVVGVDVLLPLLGGRPLPVTGVGGDEDHVPHDAPPPSSSGPPASTRSRSCWAPSGPAASSSARRSPAPARRSPSSRPPPTRRPRRSASTTTA